MSSRIVVFIGLILFAGFAFYKELHDQPNCYRQGIPDDKDDIKTVYKKIDYCLIAETKAIKWRRCFLVALGATAVIFALVYCRLPKTNELLLFLMIIYSVCYFMLDTFSVNIIHSAIKNGRMNIEKLKLSACKTR